MVTKPVVAKHKFTLNGSKGDISKQIATSWHEVVAILVTGETSDIMVGVYDTDQGDTNGQGEFGPIFVGANQGESMSFCPNQGIPFSKGIFMQIEQGGGAFNGKATILFN